MKFKKLTPWIPTFAFGAVTLIAIAYYAATGGTQATTYIQLVIALVIPAIVPVLGIITKKHYPLALSLMVGILVLFGLDCAKAFNFYSFVPEYDKYLHSFFGLAGSVIIYIFILRWNGGSMKPLGIMFIAFIGVMGLGAIWEVLEYYCSFIPGEDPQGVWGVIDAAIESGQRSINPMYDTIEDLLVTMIGSAAFILWYYVDCLFDGKSFKKLFTANEEFSEIK